MSIISRACLLFCLFVLSPVLYAEDQACGVVPAATTSPARVNINTATAEQLSAGMKGIGKAKAAAIIEWRETNGAFKSLEDLDEVKGIGPGLIEKNREIVVFRDE